MHSLKVLLLILVLLSAGTVRGAQKQSATGPNIGVDHRVELMAIIFRLAGNREYNQGKLQPYISKIDRHFGPFRQHEAIKLATEMREKMGIGFDTVMYLAVNMNNVRDLQERVPFDAPGDLLRERGLTEPQVQAFATAIRGFLTAARAFVVDSKAQEFFTAHQKFYDEANARLRLLVTKHADLGWFDRFYGKPPAADFFVVPLLANSETNFGPRVPGVGMRQELYAILTTSKTDAGGMPIYDEGKVGTLVHEFSHSFVNPLVESRRGQFEKPGTSFRMQVKLESNRDYELFLNRLSGGAFAGKDGILLAPYQIQFHTQPQ